MRLKSVAELSRHDRHGFPKDGYNSFYVERPERVHFDDAGTSGSKGSSPKRRRLSMTNALLAPPGFLGLFSDLHHPACGFLGRISRDEDRRQLQGLLPRINDLMLLAGQHPQRHVRPDGRLLAFAHRDSRPETT